MLGCVPAATNCISCVGDVTAGLPPRLTVRQIGPVAVVVGTRGVALGQIVDAISRRAPAVFTFANAHSINLARRRPAFASALAAMTVLNDGIGLDLAGRLIHGARFPENLNGTDLTPALLAALPGPTRVFLLGSRPGVAEAAATALARRFPQFELAGTHHGFFSAEEAVAIARRIVVTEAALVLVGMGQPHQELWAATHGASLPATICCVGAYLDFAAGVIPRAPGWVQSLRLEWAFRLAQEPRRLAGRYLIGNATFLAAMALVAVRQRIVGRK